MLLESPPTQFDLNWRMFGIPVRVSPWFWLTSLFLGWSAYANTSILLLVIWVLCVFVSVLIHELGHVVVGTIFGSDGHILLYSFGGLAIGSSNLDRRWQRIAVSFAGPLAQFLLLIPIVLLEWVYTPSPRRGFESPDFLAEMLAMLFVINLFWPLLNLLPIWPLDGGQISRELFQQLVPRAGVRWSLMLSLGVSASLAVVELMSMLTKTPVPFIGLGSLFGILFFGLFAAESWMLLQQARPMQQHRRREEEEDRLPWETDPDAWKRGRRDQW
ncbi:MAG: site-2 protease family protein [Gemmataceae bacterium]|nr:site-2 protease family protein [Gemmataceae bacterium]